MRKPKIYLETTLFNYYFDTDRDGHADTVKLFKEVQAGKYEAYTSAYVVDELGETKDDSKRLGMLALIGEHDITILPGDDEAQNLADIYINEGVIPASKKLDSLHIAIATINDLDYIFSYNFHHINRDKTKKMTSVINFREGYKPITIATASEVVEHGENE